MASIVLAAAGTALGGPICGAIGSIIGAAIDARIVAGMAPIRASHHLAYGSLAEGQALGTLLPALEEVERTIAAVKRSIEATRPRPIPMPENLPALGAPHPSIGLPDSLYGAERPNSAGLDLSSEQVLAALAPLLADSAATKHEARPLVAGDPSPGATTPVLNPADHADVVGEVEEASPDAIDDACAAAAAEAAAWAATPPAERAAILERAADALETDMPTLLGLLVREAGKTLANGIGEVREAVDFMRYYSAQIRANFSNETHRPLGPIICISPWNFPLAIFSGQVVAALAAGNPVLAKPAGETPLIAARAVGHLHAAGVPRAALQLLPGGGNVGAALVADSRIRGVMFTGPTEVARLLQAQLADRLDDRGHPLVLVAETGGQNALVVDSSALTEQVVGDVVQSAFDSAGQRCSALRLLCVQKEGPRNPYRDEWLVHERAISINTTAAGGNASLMSIG